MIIGVGPVSGIHSMWQLNTSLSQVVLYTFTRETTEASAGDDCCQQIWMTNVGRGKIWTRQTGVSLLQASILLRFDLLVKPAPTITYSYESTILNSPGYSRVREARNHYHAS